MEIILRGFGGRIHRARENQARLACQETSKDGVRGTRKSLHLVLETVTGLEGNLGYAGQMLRLEGAKTILRARCDIPEPLQTQLHQVMMLNGYINNQSLHFSLDFGFVVVESLLGFQQAFLELHLQSCAALPLLYCRYHWLDLRLGLLLSGVVLWTQERGVFLE